MEAPPLERRLAAILAAISRPYWHWSQREEQRFNLGKITHLRFIVIPNKSGSGTATVMALRFFA